MAKSSALRATARFKQLSCFGLPGEVVIPELLRELHAIIPSQANTFVFSDGDGVPTNMYLEKTDSVIIFPLYQKEYHERRDREFKGKSFSDAVRSHFGVHEFRTSVVDAQSYYRSDQYNLIERAAGNDANYIRLVLRSGGRVLGGLTMWRALGAGSWDSGGKASAGLPGILFFAHALTTHHAGEVSVSDSGQSGLVITDQEGRLVDLSAKGGVSSFMRPIPTTLWPARRSLCRLRWCGCEEFVRNFFADDGSVSAPIYDHSNVWGRFTFRAEWLDQGAPGSGLIAIIITHKVPLPIRLTRNVKKLPLSRRQAESRAAGDGRLERDGC